MVEADPRIVKMIVGCEVVCLVSLPVFFVNVLWIFDYLSGLHDDVL